MPDMPLTKLDRRTLAEIASINLQHLKSGLDELLSNDATIRKVLLISPVVEDYQFIRRHYPHFKLYITQIHDWNLNDPCTLKLGRFDLAIASNVMMYSHAPQRWIDHVLGISRYFAMQDLVHRKRSAQAPYLGTDKDAVRYCHSGRGVSTTFPEPFDLAALTQPLVYFTTYEGGLNEFHGKDDAPVHCMVIISAGQTPRQSVGSSSPWQHFRFKARNILFASELLNRPYRGLLKMKRALTPS